MHGVDLNALKRAITDDWGWAFETPIEILDLNDFGNAIIRDASGKYFRIIPEDLARTFLTDDLDELKLIMESEEFQTDWAMHALRQIAKEALGPLEAGQCYHLVIPSVLGGSYSVENIRRISAVDWLGASGNLAQQIEGMPDGEKIKLATINKPIA